MHTKPRPQPSLWELYPRLCRLRKGRQAELGLRLVSGCFLVLSISEGKELWALSDGTPVTPGDAGALRHALGLQPRDAGLFPCSLPQSFAIKP